MATESDRQILIRNVLIVLVLVAGSVALTLMWTGRRDAGGTAPGGEVASRTTQDTGPPAPPPALGSLAQDEPAGSAERRRAEKAWRAYEGGQDKFSPAGTSPLDWFRSYGPAERAFTVTEEYLAVRSMNLLLVLLTVPEGDLTELGDEAY